MQQLLYFKFAATLFDLQQLYFIFSNFTLFAATFLNLRNFILFAATSKFAVCPLWATVVFTANQINGLPTATLSNIQIAQQGF